MEVSMLPTASPGVVAGVDRCDHVAAAHHESVGAGLHVPGDDAEGDHLGILTRSHRHIGVAEPFDHRAIGGSHHDIGGATGEGRNVARSGIDRDIEAPRRR